MILSSEQIDSYKENGAIVIKGIFKPWINLLREGFEKVLKNPGPHARENTSVNENGRFFEDYCNWERIEEFKNCIYNSLKQQKLLLKLQIQNQYKFFMTIFLLKNPAQANQLHGIKTCHIIV